MRLSRRMSRISPWTLGVVLACLAIGVLADVEEAQYHEPAPEALIDVCAPLVEARTLLAALQPGPNAHLIDKVGSLATDTRSWGRGLGWTDEGPLSTTLRLLPRFLRSLTTLPTTLLQSIAKAAHVPGLDKGSRRGGSERKISRARRERVERLLGLINEAERDGCAEALSMKAKLRMFPPKGMKQDLNAAREAYTKLLESAPNPEAQFFIGFFHATGLAGAKLDQGKATLYYTFSALQGYRPAEMALGYRHWAGIGVNEDCLMALDWYEAAAEQSYAHFLSGPPGGRTLPLTPTRLSDRFGGIYGPHASWASTGTNALRAPIRASSASARGETEKEVLEYYQYHSDRDSPGYTVRLGRLFYFGSVYFLPGGTASGAEGVGEIPQDYKKAKEYFTKVVRGYWPLDFDAEGKVLPKRKMSKEVDEGMREAAMVAAGFLGRMGIRGEGGKADWKRGRMWLERAAELGDREAHNALGIIYRDGLLVNVDKQKAYAYFGAAAGQDLAEAQVNLAKLHLERGEIIQATQYLEAAIRHGSPYEAFHLLARIQSRTARAISSSPTSASPNTGACGVAVAWYKLVSEKGDWTDPFIQEADKAYLRGEEDKAILGWWISAEMGYEAGQNNVAFALERGASIGGDKRDAGGKVEWVKKMGKEREVGLWVRSAAQDNVDAMVKVGDLFYQGVGTSPEQKYEKAASYYQTAADTQTSSMAYWNLAWMYQNGQGVPRDWHLAKRYYDLAGETSQEAGLAVGVSLVGLYLNSWWIDFKTRGQVPGLPLFEDEDEAHSTLSAWDQLKSLFSPPIWDPEGDIADNMGEDPGAEDWSRAGSGWRDGEDAPGGGGGGYIGAGGGGGEDDLGMGGMGDDLEDVLETVVILALVGLLGGLVWIRGRMVQAAAGQGWRQDGMGYPVHPPPAAAVAEDIERRERERREREEGLGMPVGWEPPLP